MDKHKLYVGILLSIELCLSHFWAASLTVSRLNPVGFLLSISCRLPGSSSGRGSALRSVGSDGGPTVPKRRLSLGWAPVRVLPRPAEGNPNTRSSLLEHLQLMRFNELYIYIYIYTYTLVILHHRLTECCLIRQNMTCMTCCPHLVQTASVLNPVHCASPHKAARCLNLSWLVAASD